jgi:glycerol kinase
MQLDSGYTLNRLRVDGGATQNQFLMQLQSDILNIPINRPNNIEATSRGAAYLAGLATDIWELSDLPKLQTESTVFTPNIRQEKRFRLLDGWKKALTKTLTPKQL